MKRRILGGLGAVAAVVVALYASGVLAPWWHETAMRRPPRPLDVLLVTLDTTRADRLGVYGWAPAETPRLDGLAAQGVLFRQAFSHVPLTFPSHSSLMTGLLPTHHGQRDNGVTQLPASLGVLAERFREAGYRTGAFVSAFVLDRRFGLARGFDTFADEVPGADASRGGDPSERSVRAEETVAKALAWLEADDLRPRFVWVHLFDPHAPYDPPEPFRSRHAGRPYDGEIAYMDTQVGRLLDRTAASGRSWLTVVAGDHGEGLGDHQELTHGYFVYGNTQHVPLMMALPGRVPAGRTLDGIVRTVDIAPTMLELAGLPPLASPDGTSLVPLMAGRATGSAGPAYLESFHPRFWWGAREIVALRTDQWLFIESPRPELYDVSADPGERTNLAGSRRQVVAELRSALAAFATREEVAATAVRLDPAAEARLRSLGYLGSGRTAEPAPGAELPDAKDNGPLLAAITEGHELAVQGRQAEALVKFQEALAKNVRSVTARIRVAETLLLLRRYDEAFTAYGDLAATGESTEAAYLGMAQTRLAQGNADAALAVVTAGLQAHPASVTLNARAGELLAAKGQVAEAEQAFRRALAEGPQDEAARLGLSVALLKLGRRTESVELLLALVEESPQSPQARGAAAALAAWGDERLEAGAADDARRAYEAAIATGTATAPTHLNLGLALWQMKRPSDALQALDRGVAQFPTSVDLQYRRGRLLQQAGRAADAAAAFRTVLALAPGHPEATAALAGR